MKTNFNFVEGSSCGLHELPPDREAVVEALEGSGPADRRLMDLGMLPETTVRLVRRAPLGDPAVYSLRGYQLCLRKTEACRIRVRILPDSASA